MGVEEKIWGCVSKWGKSDRSWKEEIYDQSTSQGKKNFKGKKFLMTETVSPNYFNSEVKDTERDNFLNVIQKCHMYRN